MANQAIGMITLPVCKKTLKEYGFKFNGQTEFIGELSRQKIDNEKLVRCGNFLLETNRLNVAISRAKCLSIIVGSKSLLTSSVNSINEAQLINNICRIQSDNQNLQLSL